MVKHAINCLSMMMMITANRIQRNNKKKICFWTKKKERNVFEWIFDWSLLFVDDEFIDIDSIHFQFSFTILSIQFTIHLRIIIEITIKQRNWQKKKKILISKQQQKLIQHSLANQTSKLSRIIWHRIGVGHHHHLPL